MVCIFARQALIKLYLTQKLKSASKTASLPSLRWIYSSFHSRMKMEGEWARPPGNSWADLFYAWVARARLVGSFYSIYSSTRHVRGGCAQRWESSRALPVHTAPRIPPFKFSPQSSLQEPHLSPRQHRRSHGQRPPAPSGHRGTCRHQPPARCHCRLSCRDYCSCLPKF